MRVHCEKEACGGMGSEIRGQTKLEVYKKYRAKVNRRQIEEGTGPFMDAGNETKPELYRSTKKDSVGFEVTTEVGLPLSPRLWRNVDRSCAAHGRDFLLDGQCSAVLMFVCFSPYVNTDSSRRCTVL